MDCSELLPVASLPSQASPCPLSMYMYLQQESRQIFAPLLLVPYRLPCPALAIPDPRTLIQVGRILRRPSITWAAPILLLAYLFEPLRLWALVCYHVC